MIDWTTGTLYAYLLINVLMMIKAAPYVALKRKVLGKPPLHVELTAMLACLFFLLPIVLYKRYRHDRRD